MSIEVYYRLNKLLFDDRQNVTTTAQSLLSIFSISDDVKKQIKTIVLTNLSTNEIYFGVDATVTTANSGGVLFQKQKIEISLKDINFSPFFIASANSSLCIEVWG